MKTYTAAIGRVEYHTIILEIEADSLEEACEKAQSQDGVVISQELVNADENVSFVVENPTLRR